MPNYPDQTQKIRRDGKVSLRLIGEPGGRQEELSIFNISSSTAMTVSSTTMRC